MLNKVALEAIVLTALQNINDERGADAQIAIASDTRLFGSGSVLDSLALVSVIVDVEAAVSDAVERDICLTDDRAMSQDVSPFTDVTTLADYIFLLLSEEV